MVADVEHDGFEPPVVLLQKIDDLGEEVVRIENRVVVRVMNLFLAARAKIIGLAYRREPLVLLRIALVVGGAVIAHLVKHNKYVALLRVYELLQAMQHALVSAFSIVADGVQFRRFEILVDNAIGNTL
jgi:hypothetical protein